MFRSEQKAYINSPITTTTVSQRLPQVGDIMFGLNTGAHLKVKSGEWWLQLPADNEVFDMLNPLLMVAGMTVVTDSKGDYTDDSFQLCNLTDYSYIHSQQIFGTLSDSGLMYPRQQFAINYKSLGVIFLETEAPADHTFRERASQIQATRSEFVSVAFSILRMLASRYDDDTDMNTGSRRDSSNDGDRNASNSSDEEESYDLDMID